MKIAHNKVSKNTYTGYGMGVSCNWTMPDPFRNNQTKVLANGRISAHRIPKNDRLYCALMSRTASRQASSRPAHKSANIARAIRNGLAMDDSGV